MFYMLNSIAFLILTFIPVTSLIYRIIFGIASWEIFSIWLPTRLGSTAQTDPPGKECAMNLHLSDWEWLRVVTSLLFIWRGIQDLRDRSGTAWKTEDERKNFRKFSGVTLILGGVAFLFNTILPDIEPWNIILLVAAYLACIGFVISNLCYHAAGTTRIKNSFRLLRSLSHPATMRKTQEVFCYGQAYHSVAAEGRAVRRRKGAVKAGIKEGWRALWARCPACWKCM